MSAGWPLIGATLTVVMCIVGCIVPPEIEVSGNYPPTIDLTVMNDPPPYERDEYGIGCDTWAFRLPRIAINDRNNDDDHYVRFFHSDREAANGWFRVFAEEAGGMITAQIDPTRLPAHEEFVGNRIVLYALITDRPWPSAEDLLEVAPGAGWTELFWVIEIAEGEEKCGAF